MIRPMNGCPVVLALLVAGCRPYHDCPEGLVSADDGSCVESQDDPTAEDDTDAETGADADGDGWTVEDGDCDDADAASYPGGTETCDGADNDCDGTVDEDFDADVDGHFADNACAWGDDCDDSDATTYLGASEACDGADNDCDGTVDEDFDADGDGHLAEAACSWGDDCDDSDATTYLGASEACDGADNDCDGSVDEGLPDADGDGYDACTGSDCDDADAAVYPGAVADPCGDGTDQDCDGTDYCVTDLSAADAMLVAEEAYDRVGYAVWGGDLDGDGLGDVILAAEAQDASGMQSGAAYVVYGPISGALDLSAADAKLVGEQADDYAGTALWGGDLDGDGVGDALIGAYRSEAGGAYDGAAYVVAGPFSGTTSLSTADATLAGEGNAGVSVWGGDLDGDGVGDALVGAYLASYGGVVSGAAHVVYGPFSGTHDLSAADATLVGEDAGDYAGLRVWGGDLDGDGLGDVIVGAPQGATDYAEPGAAYVVLGPFSGTVALSDADAKLVGESDGGGKRYLGIAVQGGDFDGDGVGDALVGADRADGGGSYRGAAYVVRGPLSGTIDAALADAKLVGEDDSDGAGVSVWGGDLDGDGIGDAIVGANYDDDGGTDAGAAYVVLGPLAGTIDLTVANAKLVGYHDSQYVGSAVSGGDLDGDGRGDALVGAALDDAGGSLAGAVYLILGAGL